MLSIAWEQRKSTYDFVIIGSGYGGAISAARLASADLPTKPSVCILERGKEWQPGDYPETTPGVIGAARSDLNPLGLYEFLTHPDISIIKGSGLGGTSLINANVAIVPDREVFEQFNWPSAIDYDALLQIDPPPRVPAPYEIVAPLHLDHFPYAIRRRPGHRSQRVADEIVRALQDRKFGAVSQQRIRHEGILPFINRRMAVRPSCQNQRNCFAPAQGLLG